MLAVALILTTVLIGAGHLKKHKIVYDVADTLPDGGGKRVSVILLGGQSNASGCSLDEYLQKNVTPEKYDEYSGGYDNVYINYLSGKNMSGGFVKCSTLQGELEGSFGPELGLAEKLHELYPDETFFIIKCAWGATDLFEQWLSPSSDGKTGKLYKHFTTFVKSSMDYLISKNYDARIEAMCWMQGESDSFSTDAALGYGEHLTNLITDIRKKFRKHAAEDGIAFVDAYIADNPVYWVYCDMVNECKTEVAASSPLNTVIDTSTLITTEEPADKPDIPHYDSLSEIKLGHLFAEAVAGYLPFE